MEDYSQVFGDIYETISYNPQQILDVVSSGVDIIQPLDQPDVPLYQSTKNNRAGRSRKAEIVSLEKTEHPWQRVRWADEMVRLLITAVCYFSEEAASSDGPERETGHSLGLMIKSKWRSISKTLVERGYVVSPQQCEDKFNDLNKKYKRLNDLVGGRILADVIENPEVIEAMNIPEKAKEEVRKILSCRQLFYREMSSYHDKDMKFIIHDESLQMSVRSELRKEMLKCAKKRRRGDDDDDNWMISYSLELGKKKLKIEGEMVEIEMKRYEWLEICEEEDRELHEMKMENEVMRLENESLGFELRCRERGDARD